MAITLSQLLQGMTSQQIFDQLISVYQASNFPITAWQIGGLERTRLSAFSTALADVSANWIPLLAGSGLVDTAETLPGNWLALLAQELYNLTQTAAQNAKGTVKLTATSGINSQTITAGQLTIVFPSGNRYINTTGGTLNPSGSLFVTVQSEFAQDSTNGLNYNQDASNASISLVNPIPGVTVSNPNSAFSPIVHVGPSIGSLNVNGGDGNFHNVIVNVSTNGNITNKTATFEYNLDGAGFVNAAPLFYSGQSATFVIPSTGGVQLFFSDNGFGSSSTTFYENDTFQFQEPGNWLFQFGVDLESNVDLAQRCKDRWPTLSQAPTDGSYRSIIKNAQSATFPSLGAQATNILVVTDGYVNNKINLIVAGPNGTLSSQALTDLQAWVNAFAPITDFPVVTSPNTDTITIGGNVFISGAVNAPPQSIVQDNINVALQDYIDAVGINGTIVYAELIAIIMNIFGVVNVKSLTINGGSTDLLLGGYNNYILPTISDATIVLNYVVSTA